MKRILQWMLPCLLLAALGVQAQNEQQMFWMLNQNSMPVPVVQYALKKVNPKYTGDAIVVRNAGGTPLDIPFLADGNLDETALLNHVSPTNTVPQTGFAAGYSLRKINSAYTGAAIKVRRDDNTESTVPFGSSSKYLAKSSFLSTTLTDVDFSTIQELNEITSLRITLGGAYIADKPTCTHFTVNGQDVVWANIPTNTTNFSFWAVHFATNARAVKIELNKIGTQWQAKAVAAKYVLATSGASANYNFDTSGTTTLKATSQVANGYGVSSMRLSNFVEGGNIDWRDMEIFSNSGDVYVTTLYDQSGNNIHLNQTTTSEQPQIVTNGVVYKRNNKPALKFDAADDWMASTESLTPSSFVYLFGVWGKNTATTATRTFNLNYPNETLTERVAAHASFSDGNMLWDAPERVNTTSGLYNDTDMHQDTFGKKVGAGGQIIRRDGNLIVSGAGGTSTTLSRISLGRYGTTATNSNMAFQEMIVYNTDQTNNLATIEASQTSYWISGGYISTFYDQSGNGIDATQTSTTQQPKIVAGGTVLDLPTFDGSNDAMKSTTLPAAYTQFTLNFRINAASLPTGSDLHTVCAITDGGAANTGGLSVDLKSDGILQVQHNVGGTAYTTPFTGMTALTAGQVYFVSIVADASAGTLQLYVDGAVGTTVTWPDASGFSTASDVLLLGANVATGPTGGTVSTFTGDGTIGTAGVTYRVHKFTNVGTSTFNANGLSLTADYLVVGGGGGGGGRSGGGGGGGGGVLTGTASLSSTNPYTITVGTGGNGGLGANGLDNLLYAGIKGVASSITNTVPAAFSILAKGGGGGEYNSTTASIADTNIASGGGAGRSGTNPVDTPDPAQGFAGGSAVTNYSGGGGGASQAGANGTNTGGGNGGNGISSSITGTQVTYGGGGGGGIYVVGSGGSGGAGGGGRGGSEGVLSTAGQANTGGGGGGAGAESSDFFQTVGSHGGSGIVVIRYPYNSLPNFFNGKIDYVSLYSKKLTAKQIEKIYNQNPN